MITLKLKYTVSDNDMLLINEYQKQYNHCLRFMYNRFNDNPSINKQSVEHLNINNIPLIECYFKRCAVINAYDLYKTNKELNTNKPIIFGGKLNFIKRCKHQISKEDFNEHRLLPIYSMGEANQKGNRKFQILDNTSILFKPNKTTHIVLNLIGIGHNRSKYIDKLIELQDNKNISITYKLDKRYVYIIFDESQVTNNNVNDLIENRVMAIDINPNYIGWSIVDWKSSNNFKLIKTGVYSIKQLNDIDFNLKGKGYSSDSNERQYISNKRMYETLQISKSLINKAIHYKCKIFCIEDINIKSSDKGKGKRYNKLVNNCWNRYKLVNNITKRCNINNITLIKVKANYSSFIGNIIFRWIKKPDMVLASMEIGRRGWEYKLQYIDKIKEEIHNIISPRVSDFYDRYKQSLEELGINVDITDLVDLYYYIKQKTPKLRYRVSLDDTNTRFFRYFSLNSQIMQTY